MRRWPFVLLFAIPLVDVVLLVYVASVIGGVETVLLVVLTALIGMLLVRAEGRHTLGRLQRKLAAGAAPTGEVLDGALLLVAGAFLLTPGLVTDLIGLLLVLPPTRYPIRVGLTRWVVVPMLEKGSGGFVSGNVYTFEFPGGSGVGNIGGTGGPGWGGPGDGPGAPGGSGSGGGADDDVHDLGTDAYHVDVEAPDDGDDDRENGNA